nr:MAG: Protein of unknown function (DUF1642) [Bacteriophage sp.]
MTRQEAIQTLSKVGKISVSYAEDLYDSFFEKPVVPQCVAKWYEGNKQNLDLNLSSLVFDLATNSTIYHQEELKAWVNSNKKTFITTIVNMHQFGYEVEKEARYMVRFKWLYGGDAYLTDRHRANYCDIISYKDEIKDSLQHTRKELEDAGFEWVFNCPGVEVKEVE